MCLIVHSDGHLTIKMLYEQLRPNVLGGELRILECYDLVFRSHSPTSLDSLCVLSPQTLSRDGVIELVSDASLETCDWIMSRSTIDGTKGHYNLEFPGPADEVPLQFEVTRLQPKIDHPRWIKNSATADPGVGVFGGTGMTMAELTFGDGVKILPFDPNHPRETTYWLRLAFVPDIQHLTSAPFVFELNDDALFVQPCSILSPEQVLVGLDTQLNYIASVPPYKKAAPRTREKIFSEVFEKPRTSTRVEDHRISIVTGSDCLVLNMSVDGDCGFLETKASAEKPSLELARTWFTGAKHYSTSDPLTLAREVYNYLNAFATVEHEAKTKEAISSALSCQSHPNVSHVVEALRKLDLIHSPRVGMYIVNEPPLGEDKLFLKKVQGDAEIDLGGRDNFIREVFYGELPLPETPAEKSRFWHKGFRIFYDLAYRHRDDS